MDSLLSSINIHDHTGDQYSPSMTSEISQYPIGSWHLEQPKVLGRLALLQFKKIISKILIDSVDLLNKSLISL